VGDEITDESFNFANARRRSNSSNFGHDVSNFKTKFEVNDPEPVFEEHLHGAQEDDLTKTETSSSNGSVDEKAPGKEN
jgi:hypothetical protein